MLHTAIVILNWNGRHYLEKFLPTLIKYSSLEGVSVVVADNGSNDGSVEWLKENYPSEVKLILFDKNYGYTGGYNLALRQIEAKYYLLLNSDIEVTEGWLAPLIEGMEQNPNIGISMPKIKAFDKSDSFEYAGACGGFIDFLGYPFCRGRILSNLEEDNGQYNTPLEIFWASGAAFMVRSSLFHSLGGFDDKFFAHMEEIDLCWRAKQKGWQVWVFPASVIYHVGGGTLPNNSPTKLYLNYRNNLLMLYKNLSYRALYPVLFIRLIMDGLSAFSYLCQGKWSFFMSVLKAHKSFYSMVGGLKSEREKKSPPTTRVYRRSIVFSFFFAAKRLKFSDIAKNIN